MAFQFSDAAVHGALDGIETAIGTSAILKIRTGAAPANVATAHIQGSVTATGGGGDMTLDNTSIASGQTVTITSFTLNGPAA